MNENSKVALMVEEISLDFPILGKSSNHFINFFQVNSEKYFPGKNSQPLRTYLSK